MLISGQPFMLAIWIKFRHVASKTGVVTGTIAMGGWVKMVADVPTGYDLQSPPCASRTVGKSPDQDRSLVNPLTASI